MSNTQNCMQDSGFVAGTLVHTKEGLKPIEQIKAGDFVLSKPEMDEGEASYKQVLRLVTFDSKEVWRVYYQEPQHDKALPARSDFVIAGTNQLFWINEVTRFPSEFFEPIQLNNIWLKTIDIYLYDQDIYNISSTLQAGRWMQFQYLAPMVALRADAQLFKWHYEHFEAPQSKDRGLVYTELGLGEGNDGSVIDFSKCYPEHLIDAEGRFVTAFADTEDKWLPYDHLSPDAVTYVTRGHTPLLRTIYNLEVEENHTFYVAKDGILVHDACQPTLKIGTYCLP